MGFLTDKGYTSSSNQATGSAKGFLQQKGIKSISQIPKVQSVSKKPFAFSEKTLDTFNRLIKIGTRLKREVDAVYPYQEKNIGTDIGQALQKVPTPNLGSKGQKFFKATDTETAAVNFIFNMPSAFLQDVGATVEQLSTKNGREKAKRDAINLPKTVNEVKIHVENKEWQKAYETAMANSAFTIALTASDFIPAGIIAKLGIKPLKQLTKSKKIVKEAVEEVEKEILSKPKIVPGKELGFNEVVDKPKTVVEPKKVEPVVKSEPKKTRPVEIVSEKTIKTETTKKPPFSSKNAKAVQETYSQELSRISRTAKNQDELITQTNKVFDDAIKTLKDDRTGLAGFRTALNKEMFDLAGATGTNYKQRYAELKTMMDDPGIGKYLQDIEGKIQKVDEMIKTTPEVSKVVTKTSQKVVTERKIQQPIGTGKVKESKLGLRVEAEAIAKELTDTLGDLPEHKTLNLDKQADQVVDLIGKDRDKAIDIAMARKASPSGVTPEAVWLGVKNMAIKEKNVDLLIQLANSPRVKEATALGQRIVSLREAGKGTDPVSVMQDIIKARQESFERKFKGKTTKEMTEKVVRDIKKRVKVPSKSDWNSFITDLQC